MQCPHCGADREYSRSHYHGTSFECGTFLLHDTMNGDIGLDCIAKVGRQLAAANDRAGRLEEDMESIRNLALGPSDRMMGHILDDIYTIARKALEVPDAPLPD